MKYGVLVLMIVSSAQIFSAEVASLIEYRQGTHGEIQYYYQEYKIENKTTKTIYYGTNKLYLGYSLRKSGSEGNGSINEYYNSRDQLLYMSLELPSPDPRSKVSAFGVIPSMKRVSNVAFMYFFIDSLKVNRLLLPSELDSETKLFKYEDYE